MTQRRCSCRRTRRASSCRRRRPTPSRSSPSGASSAVGSSLTRRVSARTPTFGSRAYRASEPPPCSSRSTSEDHTVPPSHCLQCPVPTDAARLRVCLRREAAPLAASGAHRAGRRQLHSVPQAPLKVSAVSPVKGKCSDRSRAGFQGMRAPGAGGEEGGSLLLCDAPPVGSPPLGGSLTTIYLE